MTYEISLALGKKKDYKEIILNDLSNPRTLDFINWAAQNGYPASNLEDMVGLKVELTFLNQVKSQGVYSNIVARKVVEA